MDTRELDVDEPSLDALDASVQAALERIGDDPEPRFRVFRRLLAVAQEEAGGRYLSEAAPSIHLARG